MKDWLRTFGHEAPGTVSGYAITSSNESLVVSILSAGTFFGALMAAPAAGKSFIFISEAVTNSFFRLHGQKMGYRFRLPHLLCWCRHANCCNGNPSLC